MDDYMLVGEASTHITGHYMKVGESHLEESLIFSSVSASESTDVR